MLLYGSVALGQTLGPVSGGVITSPGPMQSAANGMQVGRGVILHAGVGVEAGYDSNVFYNDDQKIGASLLRVTPFLAATNTARNGEVPSGLFFNARAALTYREYLSSEADISRLRAFTPSINASLEHNPAGTLALGISEGYSRLQDAPYSRGTNQSLIVRNFNVATAQARWSPGGGRLQSSLRYTNTLDWFETESLKSANSMGHEGMLDVSWRWLPKTALYFQARQGYIGYLNDDSAVGLTGTARKSSSFPLRLMVGIRGLITQKTSVALAVGYQNAFYSSGATTSGFMGHTLAAGELVIMPLFTTRITVGARHDFQNSVIGNFYYGDGGYLSLSQQASRLIGQLWGSYDYRRYYGLPGDVPRRDHHLQAGAMLDFYLKTWVYAGLSYTLAQNRSDYEPAIANLAGVNYTKHLVFARLGITY